MSLDITGKHINVTPAIRRFTSEKLEKLQKYLDDINRIEVILSVEKRRHIAEITLHSRASSFAGRGETDDLYSAIGVAIEKLEHQAKRHKEKLKSRGKKKGSASIRKALVEEPLEVSPAGNGRPAPGRLRASRGSDGGESPRIIRTGRYRVKPMTPEEAALEVSEGTSEFLVFRDAGSDRVSVVYRRPDGNFGLIEP
jgi:putative sigma-54 modulation protein